MLEDGVPQAVATFEHVSVRPAAPGRAPRRSALDRRGEEPGRRPAQPAVRPVPRHVSRHRPHRVAQRPHADAREARPTAGPARRSRSARAAIDKAIVNFLERAIGPGDLVAAMSPEMDASQMVFGRRPERFADWVSTAWARRFSWDDLEPEEERWGVCYPPDDVGRPVRVLQGHLRGDGAATARNADAAGASRTPSPGSATLREGRKAVAADLARAGRCTGPTSSLGRALPPVSSAGLPARRRRRCRASTWDRAGSCSRARTRRNPQNVDRRACDAARLRLALLDNESDYRRLLDRANRETVSFYPIDPRGLAVFDTPIDAVSPTGAPSGRRHRRDGAAPRPPRDAAQPGERDRRVRVRKQRLRRQHEAHRRRPVGLLPARLQLDEREAGRQVQEDHGAREAPGRAGARAARLPGGDRGGDGGQRDATRRRRTPPCGCARRHWRRLEPRLPIAS